MSKRARENGDMAKRRRRGFTKERMKNIKEIKKKKKERNNKYKQRKVELKNRACIKM